MVTVQERQLEGYDRTTLYIVILLTCFGIFLVYPAHIEMAVIAYPDGSFFLERQSIFAVAGIISLFIVMIIGCHKWQKIAGWRLVGSVLLLIFVLIHG